MSMNVNGSTQQMGTEWFQNMKTQKPDRNTPEAHTAFRTGLRTM